LEEGRTDEKPNEVESSEVRGMIKLKQERGAGEPEERKGQGGVDGRSAKKNLPEERHGPVTYTA